jgi:hypothetical protein
VVNLWIFRYEYYREQTNTVPSEDWREQDPWKRVFFLAFPWNSWRCGNPKMAVLFMLRANDVICPQNAFLCLMECGYI